ncbi:MAG: histidinol-phosphatase [Bacteroidales bacterium]
MTNLTNYHSHCNYCDGRAETEAFILEAIRQGFYSYGVSSHAPLPFSTHWSMEMTDLHAYIEHLDLLKKKYAGQIEIYTGLEIDYLTEKHHPAIPLFQDLKLDYRIGSVHLLEDINGDLADLDVAAPAFKDTIQSRFEGDLRQVVLMYFDKLIRMLNAGGFDIVGHADKISMNASHCDPSITQQVWYKQKIQEYFSLISRKKVMMEINTKAYIDKGFFFPNRSNFDLIRELGIPVLVNSDAHYPEKINSGRREALECLLEFGIDTVRELKAGSWVDVPIGSITRKIQE